MKSTKMAPSTRSIRREAQNLEVRYGKIGISAVAAAMRYQGDAAIPEHASTARASRIVGSTTWSRKSRPELRATGGLVPASTMLRQVAVRTHTCWPPLMWISAPFTYDDVSVHST